MNLACVAKATHDLLPLREAKSNFSEHGPYVSRGMIQMLQVLSYVVAASACSYFVFLTAFLLRRMLRDEPSQLWRLGAGLFAIFSSAVVIVLQNMLCGYPTRQPNTMTLGGNILMGLLAMNVCLVFGTYFYYYRKYKRISQKHM